MSKFKNGDKVRVIRHDNQHCDYEIGEIGTVDDDGCTHLLVMIQFDDRRAAVWTDDLELVTETKTFQQAAEEIGRIISGDKFETGVKFDNGKPPISLAPTEALLGMAEAFAYGAKKYEKHNYRKGYEWSRALDAAIRHVLAELDGEERDEESGLEHWKHALATIAMYAYFRENNVGTDDRYKKPETTSKESA